MQALMFQSLTLLTVNKEILNMQKSILKPIPIFLHGYCSKKMLLNQRRFGQ